MTSYTRRKARGAARRLLNYFLKGLLFVLPLFVSIYVIWWLWSLLDGWLPADVGFPGMGLLIVLIATTLVGWLGSGVLSKPILDLFDDFLSKTPGLKVIYNSVKDTLEAFVGDKKKFTEPVAFEMNSSGLMRPGFVTQKDLEFIGLEGYVSVYCPASYAFSGELYLVQADKVKPLNAKSALFMQFIVSGGVTDVEEE